MTWNEALLFGVFLLLVVGGSEAALGAFRLLDRLVPVDDHPVPCGQPCGREVCDRDWLDDDCDYRRRCDL